MAGYRKELMEHYLDIIRITLKEVVSTKGMLIITVLETENSDSRYHIYRIPLSLIFISSATKLAMFFSFFQDTNEFYADEYCLCKLLEGMCLRYLDSPSAAEACLREVVER